MKEYRSYIDEETGERVSGLFDMTQEQIDALTTSRLETDMQMSVSSAQALIALSQAGLLDQVTEAVNQSGNTELKIFFERQPTWKRNSPYIEAMRQALGLTDQQVTDLFRQAQSIV